MNNYIYKFGNLHADGDKSMADILGNKGANLAEMSKMGIPTPPGFTISTKAWHIYNTSNALPEELYEEISNAIKYLEEITLQKFGDHKDPLLLSVRSGSMVSMPGMMDTILNLGLNDETVLALIEKTSNERFAYDSYRRFIQMYGSIIYGIGSNDFENIILEVKKDNNIINDIDLSVQNIQEIISKFKIVIQNKTSQKAIPDNVIDQLHEAIKAVFDSWMNKRAVIYRRTNDIDDSIGTAVTIQSMVFGNLNDNSGTGVVFTRNPSTGENIIFGEYLLNAQGEDIVAGIRTPLPILEKPNTSDKAMISVLPKETESLLHMCKTLEQYYKDVQDIEFTIENGKLWILQSRSAKRTALSSIKTAVDMATEGLISEEDALLRINAECLSSILHPTIDKSHPKVVIGRGLPASPGAISGKVVFSSEEAVKKSQSGIDVILVTHETTPEDIEGMISSVGLITARGGMTSHAAVVARGIGKPCICGTNDMRIDPDNKSFSLSGHTVKCGDMLTVNGTSGEIILGQIPTVNAELPEEFNILMEWAKRYKKLQVRANADTESDIQTSIKFGAEGIGLCRTEHMFFKDDRISIVRQMILVETKEHRAKYLQEILPIQVADFQDIFSLMKGKPVNIRLLDPPLHEFLPQNDAIIAQLSKSMNTPLNIMISRINKLKETNPMLGHRGCRLGISCPEIYEMQVRSILIAAIKNMKDGISDNLPDIEIMVPFISSVEEFRRVKDIINTTAQTVLRDYNADITFKIGSMLELPRAALTADKISEESEFFCFGTNDLTQTVFGLSRDDSGKFLSDYQDLGILKHDPFVTIDKEGVGSMMKISMDKVASNKNVNKISFSVCGEHGGNPESIAFFHEIGLEYVSCSPYRIPISILASAQSAIKDNKSH